MNWTEILQITVAVVFYFFASKLAYYIIDEDLSFPKWYVAILWAPLLVMLLASGLLLFIVWVLHTILWKWPASFAKAILSRTRFWPHVAASQPNALRGGGGAMPPDVSVQTEPSSRLYPSTYPEIQTFPPVTFVPRTRSMLDEFDRRDQVEETKPVVTTPPSTPISKETKERFDEL